MLPRGWELSPGERAAAAAAAPWPAAAAVIGLRVDKELLGEGFRIRTMGSKSVQLTASTDRGFILGAGRLLRELRVHSSGTVHLPRPVDITIKPPRGQIRGTQFTTAAVGPVAQRGSFGSWESAEKYVKVGERVQFPDIPPCARHKHCIYVAYLTGVPGNV